MDGAPSTSIDQDVVAGSTLDGVFVTGGAASTTVTGSFVGTRVDGVTPLPNRSGIRVVNGAPAP